MYERLKTKVVNQEFGQRVEVMKGQCFNPFVKLPHKSSWDQAKWTFSFKESAGACFTQIPLWQFFCLFGDFSGEIILVLNLKTPLNYSVDIRNFHKLWNKFWKSSHCWALFSRNHFVKYQVVKVSPGGSLGHERSGKGHECSCQP